MLNPGRDCRVFCPSACSLRNTACWTAPAGSTGLVARAKALGQTAVAITDHGVMYGAVDFYRAAKAGGHQAHHRLRGLCGPPGPASTGSMSWTTEPRPPGPACAGTRQGYRNLCRPGAAGASLEGFYVKPRVDKELLAPVPRGAHRPVRLPGRRAAPAAAGRGLRRGQGRTPWRCGSCLARTATIWNCRTTASPSKSRSSRAWSRLHQETGIPLVATNDAHYLTRAGRRHPGRPHVHPDGQDGGGPQPDAV